MHLIQSVNLASFVDFILLAERKRSKLWYWRARDQVWEEALQNWFMFGWRAELSWAELNQSLPRPRAGSDHNRANVPAETTETSATTTTDSNTTHLRGESSIYSITSLFLCACCCDFCSRTRRKLSCQPPKQLKRDFRIWGLKQWSTQKESLRPKLARLFDLAFDQLWARQKWKQQMYNLAQCSLDGG